VSLNELVDEIRNVTGLAVPVIHRPARPLDVPISVLDCTRIGNAVGWKPDIPLAEGLRRTWTWMKEAFGPAAGQAGGA
jgi:nucleoside-diphosphate-sugar epimerase